VPAPGSGLRHLPRFPLPGPAAPGSSGLEFASHPTWRQCRPVTREWGGAGLRLRVSGSQPRSAEGCAARRGAGRAAGGRQEARAGTRGAESAERRRAHEPTRPRPDNTAARGDARAGAAPTPRSPGRQALAAGPAPLSHAQHRDPAHLAGDGVSRRLPAPEAPRPPPWGRRGPVGTRRRRGRLASASWSGEGLGNLAGPRAPRPLCQGYLGGSSGASSTQRREARACPPATARPPPPPVGGHPPEPERTFPKLQRSAIGSATPPPPAWVRGFWRPGRAPRRSFLCPAFLRAHWGPGPPSSLAPRGRSS
jgi:hypothetical protein